MTAITPRQVQLEILEPRQPRRAPKKVKGHWSFRASVVGQVELMLLMIISLIPVSYLFCLLIPGFVTVGVSTGMLAVALASEGMRSSRQAGETGWLAGLLAGVWNGFTTMLMALAGFFYREFGQGVLDQISPEHLLMLHLCGFDTGDVAIISRVLAALIVSVVVALVSGLLGAIGGMVCFELLGVDK